MNLHRVAAAGVSLDGPSGTVFGASGGKSVDGAGSGTGCAEKSSGNPGAGAGAATFWAGRTSGSRAASADGPGSAAGAEPNGEAAAPGPEG